MKNISPARSSDLRAPRASVVKKFSAFSLQLSALLLLTLLPACHRQTNVESGDATQTLHRGIGPEPATLDPQLATAANDYAILSALFEGLVAEDPLDLRPVPGVAERWTISPDNLTYTFHLRENARWTNGDPVTAQDFVNSWQRILTPALAADNANLLYILQNAEAYHKGTLADFAQVGVAAPNPRTLRVTLEYPATYFLNLLQHWAWWPVHLPTIAKHGDPAHRSTNWATPERIVTNGPFTLQQHRPHQRIIAVKNPRYWDAEKIHLNAIHFHPIEDVNAEYRAYLSGQLHITEALPLSKIDAARAHHPDQLRTDPYLGTYFYRINIKTPFLDKTKIRLALNHAIPRDAIVRKLLRGGQAPATAFTPDNTNHYTSATRIETDYPLARRLLAEAGHPDGENAPPVELLYNNSDNHRIIAETLQETWRRELKLRVTLRNMENKSVLEARRAGAYQLLRSVWIADYHDPMSFLAIFRSDSGNNHTHWRNATYDQHLYQAARTADQTARNQLYQQAETLLLTESPILPIYTFTHVFLKSPSVQNWHPTPLDHHPYKTVYLKQQHPASP